jgi:hypothetical protein
MREHLGRLVDAHDRVPEAEELMGHATNPATKLQDLGSRRNRVVNELRLAAWWQSKVEVDWTSVARRRH